MKRGFYDAAAHDPRQRRVQRARARPLRIGHVEHDEIRRATQQGRRGGKAADEGGIFPAFEQVAAGIIARMHQEIGVGDARCESAGDGRGAAVGATIRVGCCGEICGAERVAVAIVPEQIFDAGAVGSRSGAEDAGERGGVVDSGAPCRRQRVLRIGFLACGNRASRGVQQRDLPRKEIAEQAGYAPGHVDARSPGCRRRQHLDAGDASGRVVPGGPAAHQREALRHLLAARSQRRAAPKVDDERAGHLAVRLQMRANHLVGCEPAEVHRGRRRQHAGIGGEEIAAGRQHIAASARWRAGRTGRDASAVERGKEGGALGGGTRRPRRLRRIRRGCPAVDVQAVFDGEVLEIAEPGIDAAQRLVGAEVGVDAGFARKAGALRGLDDEARQAFAPPAVETVRLCVFVDQTLELARVTGQTGGDERWRQMADGHRRDAPFGLRGLAGIADDEGIEHRQRTEHRLGETGRRQRHRLARQPFERAVRAHVYERVDLVLQPQAKGDECVPRRQCRIVVVGASIARAAAVGRERDQDIAERARSESERAIAQIGIVGRVAPCAMDERRHVRG